MVTVDVQRVYEGDVPDDATLSAWATLALSELEQDCELSIRLVDEAESTTLNAAYRGKNKPTNVLSFPFDASIDMTPMLLGDLVICAPVVAREAESQKKPLAHHWAHMVVHGCLHLLGYDHIDDDEALEMEGLETRILQSLSIPDPYQ